MFQKKFSRYKKYEKKLYSYQQRRYNQRLEKMMAKRK